MYKCNNCGFIFEEPFEISTTYEAYYGVYSLFSYHTPLTLYVCPNCNDGDDLEELEQCEICGEWFNQEDLTDTTGYINGGCGYCCTQCVEDAEMIEI